MNAKSPGLLQRSVPVWAGMTSASFGAVMGLALGGAINTATTMILMIVPAALFFQMIRVANNSANAAAACSGTGAAQRKYIKRVAIFSSLYLVVFAIQVTVLRMDDTPMALRAALGVLPGLAVVGIFWAIGRLIVEEKDEFIRMLIVRQALIATGFALGLATIWGFLEFAGVVPHLDAYWVAIVWFFGQFVGAVSNRITYGSWGAL